MVTGRSGDIGIDDVLQMVASLGPYRLNIFRPGAQRRMTSGGHASPATARTASSSSPDGSTVVSAAGVTKAWVTWAPRSRCTRSSPPMIDVGAITMVDAAATAMKISNTDASKLGDAKCSTRDSAVRPIRSRCSTTTLARPVCVTTTPLGRPVEPDV